MEPQPSTLVSYKVRDSMILIDSKYRHLISPELLSIIDKFRSSISTNNSTQVNTNSIKGMIPKMMNSTDDENEIILEKGQIVEGRGVKILHDESVYVSEWKNDMMEEKEQ